MKVNPTSHIPAKPALGTCYYPEQCSRKKQEGTLQVVYFNVYS